MATIENSSETMGNTQPATVAAPASRFTRKRMLEFFWPLSIADCANATSHYLSHSNVLDVFIRIEVTKRDFCGPGSMDP